MTLSKTTRNGLLLACIAFSTFSRQASAEELSGDLSQVGNLTFGAAYLIAPNSSAVAVRTLQYKIHKVADQNGNIRAPLTAIDARVNAAALSFIHMTGYKLLGADYGAQITLPYIDAQASSTLALGPRVINAEGHFGQFVNVTLSPIMLVWRDPARVFTQNFILDVQMPIGKYEATNPLNAATDAYALRPKYTFTYLSKGGFEVTSSWSLQYNFKNRHEDYKTGTTGVVNYAVGQHFGPLTAGVSGYAMYQFDADRSNGAIAPNDGRKARTYAIGPAISYRFENGPLSPVISAKIMKEFNARNRTEGNIFWLLAAYPF